MAFTYTDGIWDPETHNYSLGEWKAEKDMNAETVGTVTVYLGGNT